MKGKDFNLFTVYRNGPSKPAESELKTIVAVVLIFVLIIVSIYSALMVVKNGVQSKIDTLNEQINDPIVLKANEKLATQLKKNELMKDYYTALTTAQKNFDSSNIIDSILMNKIIAATPENAKMVTINMNQRMIDLTYVSPDRMAPAIFTQALNKADIFDNITYNSITANANDTPTTETPESNATTEFTFTLTCELKEVIAK